MATNTMQDAPVGAQVGRSLPRLEARDKVTGRAEYTHTMRLPGMLHGKVFRSTVAHGRIKSIDVSAARKVPATSVRTAVRGTIRTGIRNGRLTSSPLAADEGLG